MNSSCSGSDLEMYQLILFLANFSSDLTFSVTHIFMAFSETAIYMEVSAEMVLMELKWLCFYRSFSYFCVSEISM